MLYHILNTTNCTHITYSPYTTFCLPSTLHCLLYTAHDAPCFIHSLCTTHCMPHTLDHTLWTTHCALYIMYHRLHTTHYTPLYAIYHSTMQAYLPNITPNNTTACQGWVDRQEEHRLAIISIAPIIVVHLQPIFFTRIDVTGAEIENGSFLQFACFKKIKSTKIENKIKKSSVSLVNSKCTSFLF